jgi:signal transduction histidine kinase
LSCIGQTKTIERLKRNVETATDTKEKLLAVFSLCEQGYSLHPDTLMAYAQKAKFLAEQNNNLHDEIKAMFYQSYALTNKGLIDSSLNVANRCMQFVSGKINDPELKANLQNQKGRCYMRKNQYKEAIDMGYQVIDGAEKIGDTLLQMKGKTLIGWAYLEMAQTQEALGWHLKALHSTTDTLLLEKYGILFANLALNYNRIGKTDSALYFINKAITYSRKNENLFALCNSLAIQAELYNRSGKFKLAEKPLKEVLATRKLIGDPFYIVSDMGQLALYYAHNGQPEKGIELSNEGISIAEQYNLTTKLFFLYDAMAENYKLSGNTTMYAEILQKIISLKDSVYAKNSVEALAEMQTKYDLAKKENTIVKQKLDIAQRSNLLYGIVVMLVFCLVLAYVLFTGYQKRQKLNSQFLMNEEKRLKEFAVKDAGEKERKRISADLHDNMGAYATAIIANVDDMINKKKESEFTFSTLKSNASELMSNLRDTIWASNKEEFLLTGISDRFKTYVQKINTAYPNIRVEIIEDIANNLSFSSVDALNIFRILQEALTNATKHSNANEIKIYFFSDKQLLISVIDNGDGIGDFISINNSNGLKNMQARAKESELCLSVKKHEISGTEITLTKEIGTTKLVL